jgi:hypothetical protein
MALSQPAPETPLGHISISAFLKRRIIRREVKGMNTRILIIFFVSVFVILALTAYSGQAAATGPHLTEQTQSPEAPGSSSTEGSPANPSRSCLPFYGEPQYVLTVNATAPSSYEPFVNAGDLNGDSLEDIVISRLQFQTYATFALDILLNNGSGGMTLATSDIFSGSVPLVQHPTEVILADLNGDGRSDIFVANSGYDDNPQPGFQNALALTRHDGKLVNATQNLPQQNDLSHSACAADIDGDQDIDLYIGNYWGLNMFNPEILLNDGSGDFTIGQGLLPSTVMLDHSGYTTCAFADVDNDSSPDLILGHTTAINNSPPVSEVLLNNGSGVFASLPGAMPPKTYDPTDKAQDIAPVDLNGDNYLDLLVVYERQSDASNYIQALINNQDGTFRDESTSRLASFYLNFWPGWMATSGNPRRTLALRDMDRDGDLDLLAKSWDDNLHPGPQLFLNDGNGYFTWEPFDFRFPWWSFYYTFLDLDRDGDNDIVWTAYAPPEDIYIIRDLGCPVFLPLTFRN